MPRFWILATALAIISHGGVVGQDQPKEPPPFVGELLKGTPDDFLKRFDKNKDGNLSKDELPPLLAGGFEKFDANGDGKLDRKEVEQVLQGLRKKFGQDAKVNEAEVEKIVGKMLEADKNKDGKLSKDEAPGRLADFFDRIDTNKDGFLDKEELRQSALRMLALKGGGFGNPPDGRAGVPDFDSLDRNADGRLTRDELRGTPHADKFDSIDTDKDGKITIQEFQAYFKKPPEKK